MRLQQILTTLFLTLTPTLALPPVILSRGFPSSSLFPKDSSPSLFKRKTCAETCGTVCYYQSTIDDAVSEGYELYLSGETEGSNKYPHKYNNYEGFDFPVSGPYQEFPILSDFEEYDGGSPGPDRVIFNEDGQLAGVITHTGASGDDFVECDG